MKIDENIIQINNLKYKITLKLKLMHKFNELKDQSYK